ncbi:toxin glutamine deamidase domain-containing protein [Kitasatospora sp. NPDC056181]|uniref:toxin glutamine deamidase domain-containing protein n=1 Tax=Kitasatospora sp. NPDC056181 TaxID=3345737 RepID=UPI0035D79DB4
MPPLPDDGQAGNLHQPSGDDIWNVLVPTTKRRAEEDHVPESDGPGPKRHHGMGRDVTPAADRGLVEPTPEQHQAWLAGLPGAPGGRPQLTGALLRHLNPDGDRVNCLDVNLALWDTMDGDPHPAGSRPDQQPERDGVWELSRRLGPAWHYGAGSEALDRVTALVREAGPGARALVLTAEQGRIGHASTVLHTDGGELMWIDPQLAEFPETGPDVTGTASVWAYVEDAAHDQIRGDGQYDELLFHDPAMGAPGHTFGVAGPERLFPKHPIAAQPGWKEQAEKFERQIAERAVGLVAHEDSAIGLALNHLLRILVFSHGPDWQEDVHLRQLLTRDDVTSAGQIGHSRLTVRDIDKMVESGNPREKYTAFYNAAYYRPGGEGAEYIGGLKELLLKVFGDPEMLLGQALGLNVEKLRPYRDYLESSERRLLHGMLTAISSPQARNFSEDPFALGNLMRWSAEPLNNTSELGMSQSIRTQRADEMLTPGRLTPSQLRRADVELSRRERALLLEREVLPLTAVATRELGTVPLTPQGELDTARIFPEWQTVSEVEVVTGAPDAQGNVTTTVTAKVSGRTDLRSSDLQEMTPEEIDELLAQGHVFPGGRIPRRQGPEFPLGSIEGGARYQLDPDSTWYRDLEERGIPAIGGLSGTATRMFNAFDWLNVPDARPEDFVVGLIGWMRLQNDHSLYEILRGAQIAGFEGVDGRTFDLTDAVSMYRSLDALGPAFAEPRLRELDAWGMLPHERHYFDRMLVDGDEGGLYALDELEANAARKFFHQQINGVLGPPTDVLLRRWLGKHGIPVGEMRARLPNFTVAHLMAIRAYTGNDHTLINLVVERTRGIGGGLPFVDVVTKATRHVLKEMVVKELAGSEALPPNIFFQDEEVTDLVNLHRTAGPEDKPEIMRKIEHKIDELLPSVVAESKLHAGMLLEALRELPVANEMTVYRGAWEWGNESNVSAFMTSFFAKDHVEFDTYASTSTRFTKAHMFATKDPVGAYRHRVVYMLTLRGGSGRDIAAFSQKREEAEVLLLPGARFRVTDRKAMPDPGGDVDKDYILIVAEEEVPQAGPDGEGPAVAQSHQAPAGSGAETFPAVAEGEGSDSEGSDSEGSGSEGELEFVFAHDETAGSDQAGQPDADGSGESGSDGGNESAEEVTFLFSGLGVLNGSGSDENEYEGAGSDGDGSDGDGEYGTDGGSESGEEVPFLFLGGVPHGSGSDKDKDENEGDDEGAGSDEDEDGGGDWGSELGEEVTFLLGGPPVTD